MGKVILDPATRAKLNGLSQPTEVYDENGTLLAYLMPVNSVPPSIDLPGPDPFSDEQISEVLKTAAVGRPTADVLRDLRNR